MDAKTIESCREQIQEDIMSFLDGLPKSMIGEVCQIVVDNFNKYGLTQPQPSDTVKP